MRTFVAFAIAIAGAAVGDAPSGAFGGGVFDGGGVGVVGVAVPAPPHAAITEIETRARSRFM